MTNKTSTNETYDFLIVGAGLFGVTCARLLKDKGYRVLVVEARDHVGGNIYTRREGNIDVHVYGAHIFHTDKEEIWDFVNKYAYFLPFIHSPMANYHGEYYHLPFNLNTFKEIFEGVENAEGAKQRIEKEIRESGIKTPTNLQEQAISQVGMTIFNKLIKEYTEKQWGTSCDKLPASIIKRIPVRFYEDNNYFNDAYQGIPEEGYTAMIEAMLEGIEVRLNCDYLANRDELNALANKIIYTGSIDEFFDYSYGKLEYRSLRFNTRKVDAPYFQKAAVVNYTSHEVPYTRVIEHKYFNDRGSDNTIITEEYPDTWSLGKPRYYPINDQKNNETYQKYQELTKKCENIYFGGRLGSYQYYDMDDAIYAAFELIKKI